MSTFTLQLTNTPTVVDLDEYLTYLIMERTTELDEKLIQQDAEYREVQAKLEGIFKEFAGQRAELFKTDSLMDELWMAIGSLEVLIQRIAYRQGLRDGAGLVKILMGR